MKMPRIKIRHSKSFEIERISESIEKLDWYRENNYYISLPRQISRKQNISKKEIRDILNVEYRGDRYKKMESKIYDWWRKNGTEIIEGLNNCKVKVFPYYIIRLTNYGTGGSYNPPQEIIINVSKKSLERIYGTIIHEIIHLGIERLIKKYRLSHFSKERLVDLLIERVSSHFCFKQNLPQEKDVKIIDEAWRKGEKEVPLVIRRFLKLRNDRVP